ncbi:MAG TPA: hypothetical protein VNX21_07970 [Candidatus Thermoplasmatota archaeon]|nr:hypothetical protein [Candidatus Thermoplasmatota archaeon]
MVLEWLPTVLEFLSNTAFYAYLIVFAVGLGWVALGLLLGGLGSMIEVIHDVAVDLAHGGEAGSDTWGAQQVGLSPFSPLMLAVFGMLFGITGMALTAFSSLHVLATLGITIVVAVALDAAVYWSLIQFLVKSQSSSLADVGEAVGSFATVATRVAPGMTGTINYVVAGRRAVASARSADAQTHEAGDVVQITSMTGGIAHVKRKEN